MLSSPKVVIVFLVLTTEYQSAWTIEFLDNPPLPTLEDLLSILVNGTVHFSGRCNNSTNVSQIEYWLFTKNNSDDHIKITSFDQIDGKKPTKILLHGWLGSADTPYIRVIRQAYLKHSDYNIISVNFEPYVNGTYQRGYCYAPAIGLDVARFICKLNATLDINLEDLHVIGHSLGGQIVAFVGKRTQDICGKLGRITSLEPSGPIYQYVSEKFRLAKSDAIFVDVTHTNQGQFGYTGSCGSVDFYINGGYVQPGCKQFAMNETLTTIGASIKYILCNHQRSCSYFAESINRNAFYATSCDSYGSRICIEKMFFASHAYMGEYLRAKPKDDTYALNTNSQRPFGQGPIGPTD